MIKQHQSIEYFSQRHKDFILMQNGKYKTSCNPSFTLFDIFPRFNNRKYVNKENRPKMKLIIKFSSKR